MHKAELLQLKTHPLICMKDFIKKKLEIEKISFYYISFKSWILGGHCFFDFQTFLVIKFLMQINGWGKDRGWCIKFATGLNVSFTTSSSHFFKNYMNIFHKTEVQTVSSEVQRFRGAVWVYILIGSKVMTKMQKNTKTQKMQKTEKILHRQVFFTKLNKNGKENICVLCCNFWTD